MEPFIIDKVTLISSLTDCIARCVSLSVMLAYSDVVVGFSHYISSGRHMETTISRNLNQY